MPRGVAAIRRRTGGSAAKPIASPARAWPIGLGIRGLMMADFATMALGRKSEL